MCLNTQIPLLVQGRDAGWVHHTQMFTAGIDPSPFGTEVGFKRLAILVNGCVQPHGKKKAHKMDCHNTPVSR